MSQEYTSRDTLDQLKDPYNIANSEGNGKFNCSDCLNIAKCKTNCNKSDTTMSTNCLRCQCQSNWQPETGKSNKVQIFTSNGLTPLPCNNCYKDALDQNFCKNSGYLKNFISAGATNVTDCSQIISTSGYGNVVTAKQTMNCQGDSTTNNTTNIENTFIAGIKIPFGLNVNEAKIAIVAILILLLLLILL